MTWNEMDPTAKGYLTYDGPFPEKLYRYRCIREEKLAELVDFEVIDEAVYLAGLNQLNDPDEGRFRIVFKGGYKNINSYWRSVLHAKMPLVSMQEIETIAEKRTRGLIASGGNLPYDVVEFARYVIENVFRVACFTTEPLNYSMWANYATFNGQEGGLAIGHGGVCIEYRPEPDWQMANLHPIKYSDEVPEVDASARREEQMAGALYSKASEWRCEQEWRISSIIQAMPPFQSNLAINSKIQLKGSVSALIFGLKTPESIISKIRSRVSDAGRLIPLKRVVRDPVTFNRQVCDLEM